MSVAIFMSALLIGPQASPSSDFWRTAFQSVMQASAERNHPRPEVAVPRLVRFYTIVEAIDAIPQYERSRMRRSLESRLVRQLEVLVHQRIKERTVQYRGLEKSAPSLRGGGSAQLVQSLIEVIVTTIAPDSWQQRGGPGTIAYYPQNPALVIRQSQSVHEQVADLLSVLHY